MKLDRAIRYGLVLMMAAATMAAAPPATARTNARSKSELQHKISVERARRQGVIALIDSYDARRQVLQDALDSLTAQLQDANARLDQLESQVGVAQTMLDVRQTALEQTMGDLQDQQDVLGKRAAESYMEGPLAFTPVLLNTTDFSSFVAANQYVSSVLNRDASTIENIRQIQARIQAERSVIGAHRTVLVGQANVVQEQQQRIADIRAAQKRTRDAVVEAIRFHQQFLAQVENTLAGYEAALASMQQESDSIAGILHGFEVGQPVFRGSGSGWLSWPVTGEITSPFGWRIHPIYHRRSFHTGIDIGSQEGNPVGAARGGTVVFTGWKGAYGLIVMVDHGSSVATIYAHLSKVYVRPGDHVSKGETVGAVGCTGWCTGPHVHFEVRRDGVPENPVDWLK